MDSGIVMNWGWVDDDAIKKGNDMSLRKSARLWKKYFGVVRFNKISI